MTAVAVASPSGSSGELQFANSSGQFDAARAFWDTTNSKLFISGSLETLGTHTVIDTQHLHVEDTIIALGTGSGGEGIPGDRGLIFTIQGETNPSFYWDESADEFRLARVTNVPIDGTFNEPLSASQGGYQDLRAGTIIGTGTIGPPEDGVYTDGLFTDFTNTTNVGTVVDRFNEVLKALAPAPGPDLDDINSTNTGVSAALSFGASNNLSSASPAYISVAGSAGIESAVDVNGSYTVTTSSNNIRLGVFDGSTHISGVLNDDVSSNSQGNNIQNYPIFSFGDGDTGVLKLEVNGSVLKQVDLTSDLIGSGTSGLGTGSHLDADGTGFNFFSTATTGTFSNGNAFNSFKHRTGKYVVATSSQRRGWNYARVQHVKSGSTTSTNYIEWVNDDDSNALATAGNSMSFTGSGSVYLSGIQYHRSGTGTYLVRVSNAYKNVHDTSNITFTTSNSAAASSSPSFTISAQSKPTIGGSEDHTKVLHITGSSTVTSNYFLSGALTAGVSVSHPLKTNLSNSGQASTTGILTYNVTDSATVTSEPFVSETYRLISGTYTNQASVSDSDNTWDSTQSLVGNNSGDNAGHNNGLQVYRDRLYSPKNTLNSGDFRNTSDGGNLDNGPSGNPNYSSASGLRVFYRKFQNAGSAVSSLSYTIAGDVALVGPTDAVGANKKFRLFFKLPTDGSNIDNTGWMDARNSFSYHDTSDNTGCAIGTVDTTDSMTNHVTFGTASIATNEYVVARIEADDDWSGYLNSLSVSFGAVGAVSSAPNLSDIDSNNSGVSAKLSFGDTLTKSGYSTVENTAGSTARNANDTYITSGIRRGIFDGTVSIAGELNENTSASGNNYPNNSFSDALTGSLQLEVNGSVVGAATIADLSSTTNVINSNAGNTTLSVSAALPGKDNANNLPDYTKFYRTATYTIVPANQRNGWNYARVIHTVTGSARNTTYVEWVNDPDGSTVTMSSVSVGNFTETGSAFRMSGITYFVSPTGRFDFTVANLYKYVYSSDADAIDFPTTTNCTITAINVTGDGVSNGSVSATSRSLPNLDTSVSDAYDDNITVQATFSVDQASSLPGETAYTVTLVGRVNHPLGGDTSTSSTASNQMLIFTATDNSTNLDERFNGEAKRIQAGTTSYSTQGNITHADNEWDSSESLNGSDAGHNTGLMIYDGKLVSPQAAGNSGDFRSSGDGGSLVAPSSNPNYGSLSNTTREYIRYFRNETGGSKTDFNLTINGTGTIVDNTTSLSSTNRIQVFAKIPHSSADQLTGFMDIAKAFETGQNSDNAGALVGSFDSSLNATNRVTFGTKFVADDEYIIVKIVADKTWTGNVSRMTVAWI